MAGILLGSSGVESTEITGGGGSLTLLGSAGLADIDTFSRAVAAGKTGTGDSYDNQRENAVDAIIDDNFIGGTIGPCVLLQDDPFPCGLVAPGNVTATNNADGTFDLSWDDAPITANRLRAEWRVDGGSYTSAGTGTSVSNVAAADGSHTAEVRFVSTSGVNGSVGSDTFAVTGNPADIEFVNSAVGYLYTSPATLSLTNIDLTGANAVFIHVDSAGGYPAPSINDGVNTYTHLSTVSNGGAADLHVFYSAGGTYGNSYDVDISGDFINARLLAFANVNATPFDQQVNDVFSTTPDPSPPSIVTPEDGMLMLFAICDQNGDAHTPTVTGYTFLRDEFGHFGYKIGTTAGGTEFAQAVTPGISSTYICKLASFKKA